MKNKLTKRKHSKRRFLSKSKRKHPIKRKSNNKKTIKKKKLKRRTRKSIKGGQGDDNNVIKKKLFCRSFTVQDVNYDGDCMYHSILRATREKGKEPGTLRNEKGEYFTPKDLRKYLVENIQNYSDIKEQYGELLPEIISQIKDGIKNPSNPNNWGSQPIVEFVNRMFGVDIQIMNKANWKIISAGTPVTDETIFLLWVNGAHYMWLKEEDPEEDNEEQERTEDNTNLNVNLIDMLKKNESDKFYVIPNNSKTDEEIIKIIRSMKNGDKTLNTLNIQKKQNRLGETIVSKLSPLYYAGKNFGLPVVKALIDKGANPDQILMGINIAGDTKVYDGETALDLLVKDFKFLLDDKSTINKFLNYNPDGHDQYDNHRQVQELKSIKSIKAPSPVLSQFPSKQVLNIEKQKIKKDSVELAIQKEIDRIGPIIDYLIPLTKSNVNKHVKSFKKMMNESDVNRWNSVGSHPTQYLHYRYNRMKKSPLSEAIKEHDFEKVKSILLTGINVNDIQSDNPYENRPIYEALDEIENLVDIEDSIANFAFRGVPIPSSNIEKLELIKIIKLLIDAGAALNTQKEKDKDNPNEEITVEFGIVQPLINRIEKEKFNPSTSFNNHPHEASIYEHLLEYAFQHGAKLEPYEGSEKKWYDSDKATEEQGINPDDYLRKLYEKSKKGTPKKKISKDPGLRVILGGNVL